MGGNGGVGDETVFGKRGSVRTGKNDPDDGICLLNKYYRSSVNLYHVYNTLIINRIRRSQWIKRIGN